MILLFVSFLEAFLNDAFSKYGTVERISLREKEHGLTASVTICFLQCTKIDRDMFLCYHFSGL